MELLEIGERERSFDDPFVRLRGTALPRVCRAHYQMHDSLVGWLVADCESNVVLNRDTAGHDHLGVLQKQSRFLYSKSPPGDLN